jgi:tRNA-binding EMAP/Myf-like protein
MNSSNNSQISWDDFTKVELRAGTVIEAEVFKKPEDPL